METDTKLHGVATIVDNFVADESVMDFIVDDFH